MSGVVFPPGKTSATYDASQGLLFGNSTDHDSNAVRAAAASTTTMYRPYNPNDSNRHYAPSLFEKDGLVRARVVRGVGAEALRSMPQSLPGCWPRRISQ